MKLARLILAVCFFGYLGTIQTLALKIPVTGGKLVPLPGVSNLFVWSDTCNVYVLRDGESALLIDLGDGGVLDHLGEIGVHQLEWVLFTHHHREQCQGYSRLAPWHSKVAVPEAERAFFERPASFRKMRPLLTDPFTVHSTSYVRPPIEPIPVDRAFSRMDEFTWHGLQIRCIDTRGNSPGSMSYFLRVNGKWLAFSGDVMLEGARMHNYFDTEWDYSFAAGIYALHSAAALVRDFRPELLLPSHGPLLLHPEAAFREYLPRLERLAKMVVRGYPVFQFASEEQDRVSRPTLVPHLWQVSPHLFKFKGPDYWPNFHMLLADSGHALVVDCGLFDEAFLDKALEGMRQHLGLKQIDAVIISHMHGDHMLEAPHLHEKWGAQIWALDNMVDKCEHPERFDYVAPVQSYGKGLSGVHIDRAFPKSGETIDWEGYKLTIEWMPGQTEFALCVHGKIDGRNVIFTGDNIDGDPRDPQQNGHEALVARNSGILEEGYIYGAELLSRVKPDLILAGHSWVIDKPAPLIKRYRQWAYQMRETFRSLSTDPDYRYWFDPFWVRAEPYRISLKRGGSASFDLHLRNFRKQPQHHHIRIDLPAGFAASPATVDGTLASEQRAKVSVKLTAANATPGVHIVAFDTTLEGQRYGELFDCIVEVTE